MAVAGCERLALCLCLLLVLSGAAPARHIVIDGELGDWEGIAGHIDPADAPSGSPIDFRETRVAADSSSIWLFVDLGADVHFLGLPGIVSILLDADGDQSTGRQLHGLEGVDIAFDISAAKAHGGTGFGMRQFSGSPQERFETRHNVNAAGFNFSPRYLSRSVEFRFDRGPLRSAEASLRPLVPGPAVRMKLVFLAEGELRDETAVLPLTLPPYVPGAIPDSETDPLARAPRASFRAVAWNLGQALNTPSSSDRALHVLKSLRPDVLLLQEIGRPAPADVGAWLAPLGRGNWNVFFGRGSMTGRVAVAASTPLQDVLGVLSYPEGTAARLLPLAEWTPEGEKVFRASLERDKIPVAGIRTLRGDRHLILASLDLRCCEIAGSMPDGMRVIEAEEIRKAIDARVGEGDAIILGGDLNLVGTRTPLDLLRQPRSTHAGSLSVANAVQLDGLWNVTSGARARTTFPIPPGRLDFLLYTDGPLELMRSFTFDSEDLSARWLAHHGLTSADSATASDHLPVVADFRWRD